MALARPPTAMTAATTAVTQAATQAVMARATRESLAFNWVCARWRSARASQTVSFTQRLSTTPPHAHADTVTTAAIPAVIFATTSVVTANVTRSASAITATQAVALHARPCRAQTSTLPTAHLPQAFSVTVFRSPAARGTS